MKNIQHRIALGPIQLKRRFVFSSEITENPGMGGSEFHIIKLAEILSKSNFKVCVIYDGIKPDSSGSIQFVSSNELKGAEFDLLITSVGWVENLGQSLRKTKAVVISHHPFDGRLRNSLANLAQPKVAVNVGRFQYFSNGVSELPSIWLPAFTKVSLSDMSPNPQISASGLTVGHISSLHPSKGFHIALKGWIKFASRPEGSASKLRVIGSSALYDHGMSSASGDSIPISGNYGRKIKSIINAAPENVRARIDFLGLLNSSVQFEIRNWDIAIQNPLGLAEADPMVVQDCLASGVPVIGSALFGMYDYTKYFKGLRAHTAWGVCRRLVSVSLYPTKLENHKLRAKELFLELLRRRPAVDAHWVRLCEDILDGEKDLRGIPIGRKESELVIVLFLARILNFFAVQGEKIKNKIVFRL